MCERIDLKTTLYKKYEGKGAKKITFVINYGNSTKLGQLNICLALMPLYPQYIHTQSSYSAQQVLGH